MLGFCSNNMLGLRLASNYSNTISPTRNQISTFIFHSITYYHCMFNFWY
jgi:hypothetical protein